MEFDVAPLLKQSVGAKHCYLIDEYSDLGDGDLCLIRGEVTLVRIDRGVLVQGPFMGAPKAVCSRCLGMFVYPITFTIQEEFYPTLDPLPGVQSPTLAAEDLVIDDYHIVDLAETVRQHALLAMSPRPLCTPDCAGLCPTCGQDLNVDPCTCLPEEQKELMTNGTLT